MVSPTPRMNSLSRTCSGTAGSSAGGVSGVVLPVGVVAHPASVSARHSERRVLRPLMSLAPRGSANVDHYLAVGPLRGLFYGLNHVLECEVRRYHDREVEPPGLHEPYDVVVYAVSGVAPYPYDLVRPGYEHVHVHGGARRGPAQVYYLSVYRQRPFHLRYGGLRRPGGLHLYVGSPPAGRLESHVLGARTGLFPL